MKKSIFFLLLFVSLMASAATSRIMLWTDPHVLDTSLIAPTESMTQMMNTNRKMLDMSEAAMTALVDSALAMQPDVVLIPGDLTKDGELVSHQKVAALLSVLTQAGIAVYVIPGNHDVGNPSAYSYKTDPAVRVENIDYQQFRSIYADCGYTGAASYDTASMSYVADMLPGVSLLALDASDNNAGDGQVKPATLSWMIAQVDSAKARGNAVIAMQHWQLLEHVDNQSALMSSATLLNRDAVRDSLMAHGVGLIFTGHFHISGISTYHGLGGAEMVEVTTGAPITFPCPYRLLEMNRHDTQLDVDIETRYIASLDTISDMWTYSEDWMQEHIRVIIPLLSSRAWTKLQAAASAANAGAILNMLPQTDSARVALFNRYLADPAITCYMIHSATNEWLDARSAGMEDAVKDSITHMFVSCNPMTSGIARDGGLAYNVAFSTVKRALFEADFSAAINQMLHVPLNSMLQDVTGEEADRTDDLTLTLTLAAPEMNSAGTGVEEVENTTQNSYIYDMTGRVVNREDVPTRGIYIQAGKKIMK